MKVEQDMRVGREFLEGALRFHERGGLPAYGTTQRAGFDAAGQLHNVVKLRTSGLVAFTVGRRIVAARLKRLIAAAPIVRPLP